MTYESFNDFCDKLKATSYVMQWGNSHVWKVGGKVFAIGGWNDGSPAFTFKTNEIDFEILSDMPGLRGAPYFASRGMKWIQQYDTPGLSDVDLERHIAESHRLVALKLTKKLQRELGLTD